jgi:hypothetical protein
MRDACHPPESGDSYTTQVCRDPFDNSGCNSYEGRYKVDQLYEAHQHLTLVDLLQISG